MSTAKASYTWGEPWGNWPSFVKMNVEGTMLFAVNEQYNAAIQSFDVDFSNDPPLTLKDQYSTVCINIGNVGGTFSCPGTGSAPVYLDVSKDG